MKQRFTKLLAAVALLVGLTIPMGMWGQTTTTYTFSSKSWAASPDDWTSGKDGNAFTANQGVQVTTGVTGANATSPSAFSNVSKIVVTYCTNSSKGKGTIKVKVGSGTEQSFAVSAPSSGGTTLKTTEFNYTTTESGNVKITVDCTTNSIYVYSIAITSSGGSTPVETSNVALASVPNVDLTATYGNYTLTEGNNADIDQGTQVTLAYTNVATGYMFSSWVITKQEGGSDVTADVLSGNTLTVPTYDINISATVSQVQQYTVTFNPGSGSCGTEYVTNYQGTIITLPSATPSANCASNGWVFVGWTNSNVDEGTTTIPDPLYAANSSYTIGNINATLYAVYRIETSYTTQEFNFASIANANNWENGTAYTPVTLSPVTLTANGGGNNGKYYTSDNSWRIYAGGGSVTVSTTIGVVLSVTSAPERTFTINNDGTASFVPTSNTQFTQINVGYGTYEYASSPTCNPKVATPELSLSTGTYTGTQTVTISCTTDGASIYYTLDGTDPTSASTLYEGAISISENKTLKAIAVKSGMDDSEIVTAVYTIFIPSTYSLATSVESGRHYIITNGSTKAMGMQNDNNRAAVDVEIDNGVATVSSADVFEFVINGPDANGFYTIYDANIPGYLYAAGTSSSNHLKTQTFCDNRGQWSISFDEDNAANIVANFSGNNARNTMRYNGNNNIFSCYASGNQAPIYLYVKDNDTNYEFYKDIAKYTTPEENQPANGWNLIASPVASVTPSAANGLLSGTYDLYYFDQTGGENGKEWKNYKANNFSLVGDNGYLYANSNDVTLKFTGTPNTSGEVSLTYSTSANIDENMRGWNLVGNPFGRVAYISGRNFYRMNDARTEIVVSTTASVNPMEGVFVKAADADDNSITFSTTAPEGAASNENQNVVLNVVRNRGTVIDRAIVSFNDGAQLPKLTINENSTKLYITQDNKDYAVVRTEAQGEMPLNFKAAENGTYTLTINPEGVEMNYLHLIDNMTGMDVDLLAATSTGSVATYTFNARTTDYSSRFRLVFAANNEDGPSTGSEAFAFYSNGNWVVSNEGEATLQVIDVNGRIVSNETINGTVATSINATPGVYMLRLVNGNEVKTQKIVVK